MNHWPSPIQVGNNEAKREKKKTLEVTSFRGTHTGLAFEENPGKGY